MRDRYIIQCIKVPERQRNVFRGFSAPHTYREVRRGVPVGGKAVYAVELTEEEVLRARAAQNNLTVERDVTNVQAVGSTIPSTEDMTFHRAESYYQWGWTGGGMVIGVIDSGLGSGSASFFNIKAARSFVDGDPYSDFNGHGSAVAAVAVPRDAQVAIAKVQSGGDGSLDSDVAASIYWLVDDVGVNFLNYSSSSVTQSSTQALLDAIDHATSQGVPFYAAAGNDGKNQADYPARHPSATGVGALDRTTGQRASFSNYGEGVDLWASGVDVWTLDASGNGTHYEGTSIASPMAVWIAAAQAGKTTPNGVGPIDITDNFGNTHQGNGAIDGTDSAMNLPSYCPGAS